MSRLLPALLALLLLMLPGFAQEEAVPSPPPDATVQPLPPEAPAAGDYMHTQGDRLFRWNDQTRYLTVHIADGGGLPGWQPDYPDRVKVAFAEWESAMNHRLRILYMPDTRGTDVVIRWRAHGEKSQGQEAGGVNRTVTWGKYIAKNDIDISLLDSDGLPYSPVAIQTVALHEIGHMLGLKGHSDNAADVMAASHPLQQLDEPMHLSARDIATINRLYALKPKYTNPQGVRLANFDQFRKNHKGLGLRILWVTIGVIPVPIPLPF